MKKLLTYLIIAFFALSCSSDDDEEIYFSNTISIEYADCDIDGQFPSYSIILRVQNGYEDSKFVKFKTSYLYGDEPTDVISEEWLDPGLNVVKLTYYVWDESFCENAVVEVYDVN